ncbi:hypothetical protein F441_03782 [Phytophthora nicotianae CJ01A1]|uniref:Uncharacterized protein n=5 Tax=Phytophthora nicotianae TaxID=4792 RepID=W2QLA6_PHYN3|nr:hypothetical protein PPTG_22280 [Phytophthora nicotianae INRA-310]ETI53217.1 hypothetical protein F443_03799 [Phytophthora nicotianae P1569]ETK93050.1 hypothetical protein L915_03693 [Phytophthora nicotianae]ETP23004.1 hypothetical protein F441_03782 [Phytophthora nicotianae CJ01A1]ETP51007.1 hypothetical protein F442_03784 [Phytophthora nicotianae P10297]ETL46475.1 hypothetical protein L916_03628 [Phytophthora nicotianae]
MSVETALNFYEVGVRIGEIRKNRCCVLCTVRVDVCKFDDEDLLPALGPILVVAPPDAWEGPVSTNLLKGFNRTQI